MKSLSKLLFFYFFFLIGCISVDLKPKNVSQKAESIKLEGPQKPFEEIKSSTGDRVWLSGSTGNTISYLTECNSNSDVKLEELLKEATAFIEQKVEIQTTYKPYNQRAAIYSLLSGQVDGVPIQVQLIIFKKNQCTYTLSYGGAYDRFKSEIEYFNTFVDKFKATQ